MDIQKTQYVAIVYENDGEEQDAITIQLEGPAAVLPYDKAKFLAETLIDAIPGLAELPGTFKVRMQEDIPEQEI